ncbi:7716_t:CDS:2, partial [Dentiscutata erythropus]
LSEKNTNIAIIPGGLTSKLQPLDVSINKPFKAKIRHIYDEWMAQEVRQLTESGRIKCPQEDLIFDYDRVENNENNENNEYIFMN